MCYAGVPLTTLIPGDVPEERGRTSSGVRLGTSTSLGADIHILPLLMAESMPARVTAPLQSEEAKRLLARVPAIQNGCALDLMVFLHRHPRTLLTSEHVAKFIGYESEDIARALKRLIEAGLLEERGSKSRQGPRMFILLLDGPQGEAVRLLLVLASTRHGRLSIFKALNGGDSRRDSLGPAL
jgi:hypothetical protein